MLLAIENVACGDTLVSCPSGHMGAQRLNPAAISLVTSNGAVAKSPAVVSNFLNPPSEMSAMLNALALTASTSTSMPAAFRDAYDKAHFDCLRHNGG